MADWPELNLSVVLLKNLATKLGSGAVSDIITNFFFKNRKLDSVQY